MKTDLEIKAFVYGDITWEQCEKAVELANQYLEKPIDIPDCCDMERFIKRVAKLPLTEQEQLAVFEYLYLGDQDAMFGKYMREIYSETFIEEYWKERFEEKCIGTFDFDKVFREYMFWGFDLEKLCGYISFTDINGELQYEKFVQMVMNLKLHVKRKKCEDVLKINLEEPRPYNVEKLFTKCLFDSGLNKKVDRYSPIEEVRKALINGIGDKCDVNGIIDACLEEEAKKFEIMLSKFRGIDENMKASASDSLDLFNQGMGMLYEIMEVECGEYDITEMEELKYYEVGDTMPEYLKMNLGKIYNFYDSLLEEPYYAQLMSGEAQKRCEWLVEQNERVVIWLRDKEWKRIFKEIKEHEESFARYYPMVRIKAIRKETYHMVVALAVNDELYEYSKELGTLYKEAE